MSSIQLIQPRHTYAPSRDINPVGHIFLPSSLFTFASRLLHAGVDSRIVDLNIDSLIFDEPVVGINVIGAPYIQSAVSISQAAIDSGRSVLIGGQGAESLSPSQFAHLFGNEPFLYNPYQNNISSAVSTDLPDESRVANNIVYSRHDSTRMLSYLSREFSFYLSQGCKHSCTFCSARRTRILPGGTASHITEEYRTCLSYARDLLWMRDFAIEHSIDSLSVYLTNLDMFQSPGRLIDFGRTVTSIFSDTPVVFRYRGLATPRSFLRFHRSNPEEIEQLVASGLWRVGFGVDGGTPSVRKYVAKPNTSDDCLDAVLISSRRYGIVPGALMVFGHNGADTPQTLIRAVDILKELNDETGAIPRPHVAKDVVPGNNGWADPSNEPIVNYLLDNPILFQNLDYTCHPSQYTHPDGEFRSHVSASFDAACALPDCETRPVWPLSANDDNTDVIRRNMYNYDI